MGTSNSSHEVIGSEESPHYILINYCGGGGYYKYAKEVADRIEAKYPLKFRFELLSDKGTTGRLEVTVFLNPKAARDLGGVVVHSKANGQGYANKDWAAFDKRVEEAVAKAGLNGERSIESVEAIFIETNFFQTS